MLGDLMMYILKVLDQSLKYVRQKVIDGWNVSYPNRMKLDDIQTGDFTLYILHNHFPNVPT